MRSVAAPLLLVALATPLAAGAFVTPDAFGWARGGADTTFFAWESFVTPDGPNPPDAGMIPDPLPEGWPLPDVVDLSGEAFISGAGNFYAFEGIIDLEARVPNPGLGDGFATTLLVQVGTLGNELDFTVVTANGVPAVEIVELERIPLGGDEPFGGDLVETLLRFELNGNAPEYVLRFPAPVSNISFDRLFVDTFTEAVPVCPTDLDGNGATDLADLNIVLAAFGTTGPDGDVDGNGIVDLADLNALLAVFGTDCPA